MGTLNPVACRNSENILHFAFLNNIPESANTFIKRWPEDFRAIDMARFIDKVKELVSKECHDIQRTLLGFLSP